MKRFLATLCLVALCCMNVSGSLSGLAEKSGEQPATGQTEVVSNKKKKKAKATPTPKPTKKPKKTATPKPTKKPKKTATPAPEPTKKPKKTATPTPEPTKKPKKTAAPTEEPTPTSEPTKKPKKTATPAPESTPTPEPTKKPKKTPTPTEAPGDEPTETPTEAPAVEPTQTPAEEPTQGPGEEPTRAPEGEPTATPSETPGDEPTEAPIEEPTDEPTQAPTEEPTEEPTAEPTEEPTEEPTAEPTATPTPAPVLLADLRPNKDEVAPGKTVRFSMVVENAKTVVWSVARSDGQFAESGKVKKGRFKWKPTASGVYTVTVNATAGELTASQTCQVIVRAAKLSVTAKAAVKYAVVGGEDLRYRVDVKGGCEPYTVSMVIEYKGKEIYKSKELLDEVICPAKGYGENKLTVTVTDAAGTTERAKSVIQSATNAKNDAPDLPRLTGDMTFAERLLAVAYSQLGYRESEENFIIRKDGSVQGWSFYGGWYGMPYEEWCAMFVSYCLEKAGIGKGVMPHSANCNRWKNYLGARYIDDEDEYIPAAGDLIFFHHDRVSKDPNFPNHIGIVSGYDPERDLVYTVEGNSGKSVCTHQYSRTSYVIVGYASMRDCMMEWDKVYKARLADQVTAGLTAGLEQMREDFTLADLLPVLVYDD